MNKNVGGKIAALLNVLQIKKICLIKNGNNA